MRNLFSLSLVFATLILTGCNILPEAQPDPTRFYVLEAAVPTAVSVDGPRKTVSIRSVDVPGYLRGRSIVVRVGVNEVKFIDTERWAEPLEASVTRVVSEQLGAVAEVGHSLRGTKRDADVTVHLLNCEGTPDGIKFVARYMISRSQEDGSTQVETHMFTAAPGEWDGHDHGKLAELLSTAVAALGAEIAGRL